MKYDYFAELLNRFNCSLYTVNYWSDNYSCRLLKKEDSFFYVNILSSSHILFRTQELGIKDFLEQYNTSRVEPVFVGDQGNFIQYNQKLSNFKYQEVRKDILSLQLNTLIARLFTLTYEPFQCSWNI